MLLFFCSMILLLWPLVESLSDRDFRNLDEIMKIVFPVATENTADTVIGSDLCKEQVSFFLRGWGGARIVVGNAMDSAVLPRGLPL